jgi:protein ImuB
LQQLAEWCERFSPVVGLDAEQEPDGLLLDVGNVAHLFGGEAALMHRLQTALSAQGLTARTAVADTLGAAWGLARWLPAEDASRAAGERLGALPIELLRLPESVVQQLQRLGIQRLETLRRIPPARLAPRFGEILLRRLDQLSGAVPEPIAAHRPRPALLVTRDLEHATAHRETIAAVCRELLQQLSRLLAEQGQGALRLECRFLCRNHRPLILVLGLYQPTVDPQHLETLLQMQWEQRRLPAAVESIRIAAEVTAPRGGRQAELFGGARPGSTADLACLLERLGNRLGSDRVVRAQLLPEAQIERAFRWLPLTGRRRAEEPEAEDSPTPLGPLLRPLRLLAPPQPIDVISVSGTRPPAFFCDRRQRYRVVKHFGPERIETDWWRGPSCRRDYYRVETEEGNRWWLFRDLREQRWYLHGCFE